MIEKDTKTFLGINLSGDPERANYLARIFAPFYEELLEVWLVSKGFESKGRPTIYDKNGKFLRKTYDYTLKKDGKYYIAEAKCYLAFDNFKHLELTTDSLKLLLGGEDNFNFFCELGTKTEPYEKYTFYYTDSDKDFKPNGKILIWPKIKKDEAGEIKKIYKFYDILSIEDAINEMKNQSKKSTEYLNLTSKYKTWTEELFRALIK